MKGSLIQTNLEKEAFINFDRTNKLLRLCENGSKEDIIEIQKIINEDPKK